MIHVVRHGRTEANAAGLLLGRADPDLDDEGRAQAAAIATALPSPATVVASPLQRTRQTAEAIDPGYIVDDRLIELDYGDYDLRPIADLGADVWNQWRSDPDFRPPHGETLQELATRVWSALDSLSGLEGDVVVVTHVSPIKAALAWALGVDIAVSWRARVAQASVTRIDVTSRGPSLLSFNDTGHLP